VKDNNFIDKQAIGFILANNLFKDINKFDAVRLGLVDKAGNILKDPKTEEEKQALNSFDLMLITIRYLLKSKILKFYDIKYSKFYKDTSVWDKIIPSKQLANYNIVKKINQDLIELLKDGEFTLIPDNLEE